MDRRHLIKATLAVGALPLAASCSREPPARPEGVPLSDFTGESTAEEVTAGLDLTGKTALVTGSNSGLGFETARVLAKRGAHVICAARNEEKAEATAAAIEGRTSAMAADLGDFASVRTAALKVVDQHPEIDMVICNAGVMELPELEQINGIEKQFAVNHLGHFVLVHHLLPAVQATEQGRVVVVSSGQATRGAPEEGIQFDNLSGEKSYDPGLAYGQSKLANALFTLTLAEQLEGTPTTANVLRPGVIPTNLGRHMPRWKPLLLETVGKVFTKTIPQGAATQCYVATAPALATTNGHFFQDSNPILAGGHTRDTAMATRLWDVSRELTAEWL